ncbi:hypothetical protein HUK49_09595 [Limosilactobacillus sp. c11Ua_112_M]|uniref:hypothetical protein n=1 Tax=Limosilactobacillus TaxID=2742598 RepID=UPI001780B776|nr:MULTISPECIES: hypothetical protein [Limosilactobacillus]MBD8088154.1 hypothetical protein [Limosilactobacillus portuensis]MEC4742696.1 hypothetical protein [Limosilactobacillus sp. c10Ua_36]
MNQPNNDIQPAPHQFLNDNTKSQNINGAIPVNDITSKIIYLLEQFGRHDEKLNNIQHTLYKLDDHSKDLDNKIEILDNKINDNIKSLDNKLSTNIDDLAKELRNSNNEASNKIDNINNNLQDKIDKNFKWTVGTLIMPIITMIITIIINFVLTKNK